MKKSSYQVNDAAYTFGLRNKKKILVAGYTLPPIFNI
jgi:hypothetical protein